LCTLAKYEQALELYDKTIELDLNDYDAYFNKGLALEELGKYDLALESYNKALELEPDNLEVKAQIQAILEM